MHTHKNMSTLFICYVVGTSATPADMKAAQPSSPSIAEDEHVYLAAVLKTC